MPLVLSVEQAYAAANIDPAFQREIEYYHTHYIGRPSPLYFAQRLTEHFGGAKLYFQRDALKHTDAQQIKNAIGQELLVRRLGKAETVAEPVSLNVGIGTCRARASVGMGWSVFSGAVDWEDNTQN